MIGKPDDGAVRERVEAMLRVASALNRLRDSRLGLIGYPALGMYTATLDHITARKVFGPEIVHIDQYQVVHRMERIPKEIAASAAQSLKALAQIGKEISLPRTSSGAPGCSSLCRASSGSTSSTPSL